MISKKSPAWLEVHIQLQDSMRKEIEIMREILGNMHQEEYFLLSNDKVSRDHVVEERSLLLKRFNDIRQKRLLATETLENLSFPNADLEKASLEECLLQSDENSCETLLLRDQLVAIFNRITMQNSRNQLLCKLSQHQSLSAPKPVKKRSSLRQFLATR
ncbi:MAG: hypothetical protein LVR00_08660 [Rhabdochlamydiaceae bacterium]|jgi:hypothetical protein